MVQKSKAIEVTERLRNRAINQGWKCPVPDQFLLSMASKGDKRIRDHPLKEKGGKDISKLVSIIGWEVGMGIGIKPAAQR